LNGENNANEDSAKSIAVGLNDSAAATPVEILSKNGVAYGFGGRDFPANDGNSWCWITAPAEAEGLSILSIVSTRNNSEEDNDADDESGDDYFNGDYPANENPVQGGSSENSKNVLENDGATYLYEAILARYAANFHFRNVFPLKIEDSLENDVGESLETGDLQSQSESKALSVETTESRSLTPSVLNNLNKLMLLIEKGVEKGYASFCNILL